jgi:hypothetical protein
MEPPYSDIKLKKIDFVFSEEAIKKAENDIQKYQKTNPFIPSWNSHAYVSPSIKNKTLTRKTKKKNMFL